MNTLIKAKRALPWMLLCAVFTMFFCVQHRGGDNILNWIDFDTIPPVITLLGNNPDSITVDHPYIEFGATAYDSVDGNMTNDIMIDANDVDTTTIGTYQVVYTVSDLSKNVALKNRTVNVVSVKYINR